MEPVWTEDDIEGLLLSDERIHMPSSGTESELLPDTREGTRTCVGMLPMEEEEDEEDD